MKIVPLVLGLMLLAKASAYAQQGSFSYFEANASQFLDQPVAFYILKIEKTPKNPTIQDGFALYSVTTSDSRGMYESEAHVKVPLKSSQKFLYKHIHSREKKTEYATITNWSDYKKESELNPIPEHGKFKKAVPGDGVGKYLVGYYFDLSPE